MSKKNKIYEGKAKVILKSSNKNTLIQYFKDDATAYNAQKRDTIYGKGIIYNLVSENLMLFLEKKGIATHFIKRIDQRNQLIKKLKIFPIEVIVRNRVAGTLSKRLGIKEGVVIKNTLIEFCYKNDKLGDPLLLEDNILFLKLASESEIERIKIISYSINKHLTKIFDKIGIILVDFKLEFGKEVNTKKQSIILGDEISPDTCRLWDKKSKRKLDKDRFRRDLGKVIESYQEVANRLGINLDGLK